MKLRSIIVLLALSVLTISCGDKDEKKDKDQKGGESSSVNISDEEAFANLLSNTSNASAAFKLNLDNLINKSGILKNEEIGPSAQIPLAMVKGIVSLDQPIRVAVLGEGNEVSVVGMVSINNKNQFIEQIEANLGDITFEEVDGISMASASISEGQRIHLGLTDNFCLIHYKDGFSNKSDSQADLKALVKACNTSTEHSEFVDNFTSESKDFVAAISPVEMMGMLPQNVLNAMSDEDKAEYQENKETLKDGWSNFSLNFEPGVIRLNAKNSYPNVEKMAVSGTGIPAEFAALLTDDQLIGFGGISLDVEGLMNIMKVSGNKSFEKFEEKTGIKLEDFAQSFDGNMTMSLIDIPESVVDEMIGDEDMMDDEDVDDLLAELNDEVEDAIEDDPSLEEMKEEGKTKAQEATKAMVLAVGINNEELLTSILDTTKNVTKKGAYYVAGKDGEENAYISVAFNKLLVTGNESIIRQFSLVGKLEVAEEAKPYMSSMLNGFFNFEVLEDILLSYEGTEDLMQLDIIEIFENAVLKGSSDSVSIDVNMDEKSTNALEQIVGLALQNMGSVMDGMAAFM